MAASGSLSNPLGRPFSADIRPCTFTRPPTLDEPHAVPLHWMPATIRDEERYAVVVCPRCRHAKGIDRVARTTTCGRCSSRHETHGLRLFYKTGDAEALRVAVGVVEAKVTGGDAALIDVQALQDEIDAHRGTDRVRIPPAEDAEDEDVVQFAASAAAGVVSVAKKVRRIFEALDGCRADGWSLEEAEAAFVAAGLPAVRAEQEIRKALVQDEVFEPRPNRLRLISV